MDISPYEDDIFYDAIGMRVWEKRHQYCSDIIKKHDCRQILDIGCNEGKFIQRLSRDNQMTLLAGLDIDESAIQIAMDVKNIKIQQNLKPEAIQDSIKHQRQEMLVVKLFQGDATLCSQLLKDYNFDAITLIEMIEHLQPSQLPNLCHNVFGFLRPRLVIVTTPNQDFNIYFKQKDKNFIFRHPDHKFEMNRIEFQYWMGDQALRYGYNMQIDGVSNHKSGDMTYGYCSQIAIFLRDESKQVNIEAKSNEQIRLFTQIDYPFDSRSPMTKVLDQLKYRALFPTIQYITDEEDDFIYSLQQNQHLMRVQDLMRDEEIYSNIVDENQLIYIIQQSNDDRFRLQRIMNHNYIIITIQSEDNDTDDDIRDQFI